MHATALLQLFLTVLTVEMTQSCVTACWTSPSLGAAAVQPVPDTLNLLILPEVPATTAL